MNLVRSIAFLIFFTSTNIVYAAYIDMGDGTVYDEERSLLWQKSDDGVEKYFADAENYCSDLNLGGKGNWTLPPVQILSGLVDKNYTPTISPIFSSRASRYFSSTTHSAYFMGGTYGGGTGGTVVDLVDFNTGDIVSEPTFLINDMIAIGYTRCVIAGFNPDAKPLNSILFLLLKPTAP